MKENLGKMIRKCSEILFKKTNEGQDIINTNFVKAVVTASRTDNKDQVALKQGAFSSLILCYSMTCDCQEICLQYL